MDSSYLGRSRSDGSGARHVVVVGPIPPPLNGASAITQLVADHVVGSGRVRRVNTASTAKKRGLVYHYTRFYRHLVALGVLLTARSHAELVLYISYPGGRGQVYLLPLIALARLRRAAIVFHHHSFAYIDRESLGFRLACRLAGRRLVHVCLCHRMAQLIASRYGDRHERIVLSNAALLAFSNVDEGRGTSSANEETERRFDRPLVVGHLGNLSMEKGLGRVIELARCLAAIDSPATVLIGGEPATGAAARAIVSAEKELSDTVTWLGQLSGAAKQEFYRSIDVFVLPTQYANEAEPLVILEAASAGIPIAAYGRGCIREAFQGAGAGLVLSDDDDFVAQVLPYLMRLSGDVTFRRAESDAARATVKRLVVGSEKGLCRLQELVWSGA